MIQYIDKSAIVAELERRIKSLHQVNSPREQAVLYECEDILSFLNTLKVKDVDLEFGIKKSVNESIIRKIVDLNEESGKHYDAVIKKEREENGFSQFAIDLFDHKVDINELRIQYIIENLKAQKGEQA